MNCFLIQIHNHKKRQKIVHLKNMRKFVTPVRTARRAQFLPKDNLFFNCILLHCVRQGLQFYILAIHSFHSQKLRLRLISNLTYTLNKNIKVKWLPIYSRDGFMMAIYILENQHNQKSANLQKSAYCAGFNLSRREKASFAEMQKFVPFTAHMM